MAVEGNVPDVDHFDREDLRLSPEMHHAQAEMAAERGEEYDPHEFERQLDAVDDPEPFENEVPVKKFDGPPCPDCGDPYVVVGENRCPTCDRKRDSEA